MLLLLTPVVSYALWKMGVSPLINNLVSLCAFLLLGTLNTMLNRLVGHYAIFRQQQVELSRAQVLASQTEQQNRDRCLEQARLSMVRHDFDLDKALREYTGAQGGKHLDLALNAMTEMQLSRDLYRGKTRQDV